MAVARSAYAIGQLEQVKLALSQEKVAKVGRVLTYHTYVNQARISAIQNIQSNLSALEQLRGQMRLGFGASFDPGADNAALCP